MEVLGIPTKGSWGVVMVGLGSLNEAPELCLWTSRAHGWTFGAGRCHSQCFRPTIREWEGGHLNRITGVPSTKEIEPFVKRVRQDTCMKVKVKSLRCVRLFASPWTVAYQAPLSMKSSRQDFHLQGIFPTQALNPGLPCCRQTLYHLSPQGSPTHVWELIKETLWRNGWGVR